MTDDRWPMTDDRLLITDYRWSMVDDRWSMTDDWWSMTGDWWPMIDDRWPLTDDRWPMLFADEGFAEWSHCAFPRCLHRLPQPVTSYRILPKRELAGRFCVVRLCVVVLLLMLFNKYWTQVSWRVSNIVWMSLVYRSARKQPQQQKAAGESHHPIFVGSYSRILPQKDVEVGSVGQPLCLLTEYCHKGSLREGNITWFVCSYRILLECKFSGLF